MSNNKDAFDIDNIMRDINDAPGTAQEKNDFFSKLRDIPGKLFTCSKSIYENPRVQRALFLQGEAVAHSVTLQVSKRLHDAVWHTVENLTKNMKDNSFVNFMFYHKVGRLLFSFIIYNIMLQCFMYLEQRCEEAGHAKRTKFCHQMCQVSAYAMTCELQNVTSLDKLVDYAFDWFEKVTGIKVDDLVAEAPDVVDAVPVV